MTDSAANRYSSWRPRDYEAQVVVELFRLSRVTVLYGAEGVGKTMLLKTGVLPLLRPRADDRNFAQKEKPRVVVPFPDRHAGDATVDRGAEITIVFDRWSIPPLTALQAQILDTLPIESARMAAPLPSLADNLAAWNEAFGVRFFIIFDCFEQYLRAPFDRPGIAEFEDEFVRMLSEPRLAAHFLLSVRNDAEALMNRFRERISGFGDAYLRLPSLHPVTTPSLAPGAQTHRPAAAATPAVAAETPATLPGEPPKPPFVLPAALTADPLPARTELHGLREPLRSSTVRPLPLAELKKLFDNDKDALSHVQPPEATASASAGPDAGPKRNGDAPLAASSARAAGLRLPVRSPARMPIAAIVAGFSIGAGAGYLAVYGYHGISPQQTAPSAQGAGPATAHTGLSTIPEPPAARAIQWVPPPSAQPASAVPGSAPPPRSPTPIKSAKAVSPTPRVAARIVPPEVDRALPEPAAVVRALPTPAAVVIDWQTAMRRELDVCRQEHIFARVVCTEKARWKHCAPDRWNTVPECRAGDTQLTRSD